MRRRRASATAGRPNRLLHAYVAAIVVAAVAALVAAASIDPPAADAGHLGALAALTALLVAAEYLVVRFRYRDEFNTLNLVEAVLAPLLYAYTGWVIVVAVVASQAVAALLRRNQPLKAVFNVAQWTLATACAVLLLDSVASGAEPQTAAAGLFFAIFVAGTVNHAATIVVVAIASREPVVALVTRLSQMLLSGWIAGWLVNGLLGILFVFAYAAHPVAVVLFPAPLAVLHLAYRGLAGTRADRVRLVGLQRAVGALATPGAASIPRFLEEVAAAFEARGAALVLGGDDVHVIVHHLGEERSTDAPDLSVGLDPGAPVRRVHARGDDAFAAALRAGGWSDCLCVQLDGDTPGALLVLDQTGLEGFEAGELTVLEALARETTDALAKTRLLEVVLDERRKLAEIVQSASDGILTVDRCGRIQTWNPAFERITGIGSGELRDAAELTERLQLRSADGAPVRLERWAGPEPLPAAVRLTSVSGEERRLSCSYSRTTREDDGPATLIVVARDVTPSPEVELLRQQVGVLSEAEAAQREVVDQLQQAVMPARPTVTGIDLAVRYVSSDASAPTGGDLYDWQVLAGGELHLAVVDVLGHGVSATRDALSVIHTLRSLTLQDCPLPDLVATADRLLAAVNPDLVATVVVARYQPATGRLRIAGGGHPPPIAISPAGEVRQVLAPGSPIGWPAAGSDTVAELQLRPDESLVLYTDGLVEAHKDLLRGLEDLARYAAEGARLPAEELAAHLVERGLAGAHRRDDVLALVLRRDVPAASQAWEVPLAPEGVGEVRRELQRWLESLDVHGEALDDISLVVSELVTNGQRAARQRLLVRAALTSGGLDLEVVDDGDSDGAAALDDAGTSIPALGDEGGRGLFLVRTLCSDVTITPSPEGTSVRVRYGGIGLDEVAEAEVEAEGLRATG